MFQIDLGSSGNLQLILPDARALDIPSTVGGLEYIQKVLRDHHKGVRNQRGYIGTLPTQHAVDKHFADEFLAKKRVRAAEELSKNMKNNAERLGVDLDRLEINL